MLRGVSLVVEDPGLNLGHRTKEYYKLGVFHNDNPGHGIVDSNRLH